MKTLEDYTLRLGTLGVGLLTIKQVLQEVRRSGLLQLDEEEQAETIDYFIEKVMTALNDQLRLMSQRIPDGWEGIHKQILQKISTGEDGETAKGD